jgi:hypothetical protein
MLGEIRRWAGWHLQEMGGYVQEDLQGNQARQGLKSQWGWWEWRAIWRRWKRAVHRSLM